MPGPQLPAHTASRPVSMASAPAAKAPASSLRTWTHSMPVRPADGVDDRVEAVADDAVDAVDADLAQDFDELVGNGHARHRFSSCACGGQAGDAGLALDPDGVEEAGEADVASDDQQHLDEVRLVEMPGQGGPGGRGDGVVVDEFVGGPQQGGVGRRPAPRVEWPVTAAISSSVRPAARPMRTCWPHS